MRDSFFSLSLSIVRFYFGIKFLIIRKHFFNRKFLFSSLNTTHFYVFISTLPSFRGFFSILLYYGVSCRFCNINNKFVNLVGCDLLESIQKIPLYFKNIVSFYSWMLRDFKPYLRHNFTS